MIGDLPSMKRATCKHRFGKWLFAQGKKTSEELGYVAAYRYCDECGAAQETFGQLSFAAKEPE